MDHATFVEDWKHGRIEVQVDRSAALQIASGDMLPRRYRYAHTFWSWVWMLSLPGAIAVGIFYKWWVGLLALLIVPAVLFKATRKAACQFMIDHALDDREFYRFLRANSVLSVSPKGAPAHQPEARAPSDMTFEEAEDITSRFCDLWDEEPDRNITLASEAPASAEDLKYAIFLTALKEMKEGADVEATVTRYAVVYGRVATMMTKDEMIAVGSSPGGPEGVIAAVTDLADETEQERSKLQQEFIQKMQDFFEAAASRQGSESS